MNAEKYWWGYNVDDVGPKSMAVWWAVLNNNPQQAHIIDCSEVITRGWQRTLGGGTYFTIFFMKGQHRDFEYTAQMLSSIIVI